MRIGSGLLAVSVVGAFCASCIGVARADGPAQAPQASFLSPVKSLAFPGLFGVPSAVAPRNRTGFVGATYADPRGGVSGSGSDGDVVGGYSVGNPLDAVSVTFGVAFTGIDPLGESGSFSIAVARLIGAGGRSATFIGASSSNLLAWGDSAARSELFSSYVSHLVGVKVGNLEVPVQISIGYGTDIKRSSDGNGQLSDGIFGGFGVGLTKNFSASISATGSQINVGGTLSLSGTNFSTTVGIFDVTNNTERRQFSISAAYSF